MKWRKQASPDLASPFCLRCERYNCGRGNAAQCRQLSDKRYEIISMVSIASLYPLKLYHSAAVEVEHHVFHGARARLLQGAKPIKTRTLALSEPAPDGWTSRVRTADANSAVSFQAQPFPGVTLEPASSGQWIGNAAYDRMIGAGRPAESHPGKQLRPDEAARGSRDRLWNPLARSARELVARAGLPFICTEAARTSR